MRTRDFAAEHIVFQKTSPVTGRFRLPMYPFLGKPFDSADDIRVKRLIILKASSCLGTVAGQVINTKRIACDVGDQMMVCQTDDDSAKWTKTRGREWLESVPAVMRLLKNDRYAQTNDLWLFRHKFLIITGPGITAAQSDQVRYVQTDESHLAAYPQGRLTEFEKRMGARWDRQATHITTAPDVGREIHGFYDESSQDEWHWRCVKCNGLILPCWSDIAKQRYNGETVFHWKEDQSDTATLESIQAICPHCQAEVKDEPRSRYAVSEHGDYVPFNPSAPIESKGYQWPVWAAHWIPFRETLSEFLVAMKSAREGDLKKHEDFVKKRECRPYLAEIPDDGKLKVGDYKVGDIWIVDENKKRLCAFDFQEGHGAEGVHFWGQADEFLKNGTSRRLDYRRLESWADCRAFQLHHGVADSDAFPDAGHRGKEVFKQCALYKWYALIASDAEEFHHTIKVEMKPTQITNPYFTQTKPQDSMSGKIIKDLRRGIIIPKGQKLPPGWCYSRTWSKPNIGFLLLRLKAGKLWEYGIPIDINEEYVKQLNSYMETFDTSKKTGAKTRILKQIRESDHAFATSSQILVGAIVSGFLPLSQLEVANETQT